MHGFALQTFGGVEFSVLSTRSVAGADLGHHVAAINHDLVEAFLCGDLLRHGFAEPSQQDAGTSDALRMISNPPPGQSAARPAAGVILG